MIQPVGFPKLPADFDYETEVHESLDRENAIFFNIFKKRGVTPKRGLLVIHGQGEHGARYQHFSHYLHDQYDLIIAPDLRGHGRSEGLRGHVGSFDEYVDDAMLAWDLLGKKMQEANGGNAFERDWFGHSMGGLVTLRSFLYRPEIDANRIICSAPALGLKVQVPVIKATAARILNHVWGSLQMATNLDAKTISHDPNVVDAYARDQLNQGKATPKFFISFLKAMDEVMHADFHFRSNARLLIQAAGEDLVVDTEFTKKFFEGLRLQDKKLIVYPGLFHEIYNEPTKDTVFADWIKWGFA